MRHTEIQIVGNIYAIYSGVTKRSHGGVRIRKIRTPKNRVSKIRALKNRFPKSESPEIDSLSYEYQKSHNIQQLQRDAHDGERTKSVQNPHCLA